jgi:hypothetical protein
MAGRSVTLVASDEAAIEGGLTLPPGRYRAVERQIEVPALSKPQFTDPEYHIELSGRQIVAMGGTLGANGLVSAEYDVTRQVREGILRFGTIPGGLTFHEPADAVAAGRRISEYQTFQKLFGRGAFKIRRRLVRAAAGMIEGTLDRRAPGILCRLCGRALLRAAARLRRWTGER